MPCQNLCLLHTGPAIRARPNGRPGHPLQPASGSTAAVDMDSWKSELIMSMLQLFCDKVRDRIRKETAMPLDLADKALANPRFLLLFCSSEFK